MTRPSKLSRKISSAGNRQATSEGSRKSPKPWLLYGLTVVLVLPLIAALLKGAFFQIVGVGSALAAMLIAARCLQMGLANEREFQRRRVARVPAPWKFAGHALVAISVFILALFGSGEGFALALLYAALALLASVLRYGWDPRGAKDVDPAMARRAGIDTDTVIDALNEAEAKLFEIEAAAAELHGRELVERLARIVASGRRILDQIEKDPSDIRRARRFLVTYLDGTRDVVARYRSQQADLAGTELADNFRHVLETVERVFGEQETVLKRNETLDLEVQIDVLRTQMEHEGVA